MYLIMITNILLRCIILLELYFYAFAQVGDECVIKSNGLNGVCKLSIDCPSAEEDARNGIAPTTCGFYQLNIPIVCCENNSGPQPNDNVFRPKPDTYTDDTIIYPDDLPKVPTKSEAKCEEYSKPLTGSVQAIPLVIDTKPINIDYVKCDYNGVALIVGGKPALPGEFPFMAAIGYIESNQIKWKCGGTLISEYFVLTAAHCIVTRTARPKIVRLGDLDLTRTDDGSIYADYNIKNTIVNDRYRFPQKYNDIALIELEIKVKFTKFIRPACLYTKSNIELPQAVATGWGSLNYGAIETSKKLMKVSLNLYSNSICDETYGRENRTLPRGIVSTMVCAGELKGGKDTCQGDSGGPLLITKPGNQCKFYVVGVTSFGRSCGQVNTPGVYTRVSDFVDWIEQKVWR